MKKYLYILLFLLVACSTSPKAPYSKDKTTEFHDFLEKSFNQIVERDPIMMGQLGIKKNQDQLNDLSIEYQDRTLEIYQEQIDELKKFDRDRLSFEDQYNYDIFLRIAQEKLKDGDWRDYEYLINPMRGAQSSLPAFMINVHLIENEEDLKNYISRLKQFKRYFLEITNGLMRSENKGAILPVFLFDKVISDSKNVIGGSPFRKNAKDSLLWGDFKKKTATLKLSQKIKNQYLKEAEKALLESVYPAYTDLISFLQEQKKRADGREGVWRFKGGDKYYQHLLWKMTTTSMTAPQIHELGLREVNRIHKEMSELQKKLKIKGNLKDFFNYAKKENFFFEDSPSGRQAYFQLSKGYINQMKKDLPKFFNRLPRSPLVVKPVEAFREKSAGLASYNSPSQDGKRPGIYYVNLFNMRALPKWEAEALAYHEGVPGHHLQLSLAQEQTALPQFRRFARFTAYNEGWGLYTEKFPKEFGYYSDPMSDFGRLSLELRRACRLVVDTGVHSLKWSKQKAVEYLNQNSPGDPSDNQKQMDRYIVMPGQATAYTLGLLKIVSLKQKAQKELGSQFDIKKFHDLILSTGSIPLDQLEKKVDDFVRSQKKSEKELL